MKAFNTAGPCLPGEHYMLDPLARLPEARRLAEQGKYFVIHAPRQSGKTTTLSSLAQALNATGKIAAVRLSCESAIKGEGGSTAEERLLAAMWDTAEDFELAAECLPPEPWPDAPSGRRIYRALRGWAKRCPLPLVLLLDEIDELTGPVLAGVLSQLREGATSTVTPFPHSVVLCGMRDVRDYKIASGGDPTRLGTSSPFNISVASLRIGDFTFGEVAELYAQHTEATGQVFEVQAVQRAFEASQGQPWLVNALARDIIETMGVPPSEPITDALMEEAVERLIRQRATHLDSLAAPLTEPRVQRIIEPMLTGDDVERDCTYDDDHSYVRDLGLVTQDEPLQIANPIYQEVIVRVLTRHLVRKIDADPRAFLLPDGRLDVEKLLAEFIAFWKANGEILDTERTYHEAACLLTFMAFLQRVVNGGGFIDREYALGRKRVDLTIRKPYTDENGHRAIQWSAYELKIRTSDGRDPVPAGLVQLDGYLDSLGLDSGTLIVFDRRKNAPPIAERTTTETVESPAGRKVTLVRA